MRRQQTVVGDPCPSCRGSGRLRGHLMSYSLTTRRRGELKSRKRLHGLYSQTLRGGVPVQPCLLARRWRQKKKEELQQEKHRSRLDRKITFDFAGRKVVEEEDKQEYNMNDDQEMMKLYRREACRAVREVVSMFPMAI